MLTGEMQGRKNRRMFPRSESINPLRLLPRVLLTLFIGAFVLASQSRVANFTAPHLPDREGKLLNRGDVLDGLIAGYGLKSTDFQSETRLSVGKIWSCPAREGFFERVIVRSTITYDSPTAGSFLIRSPPRAMTFA
jgi:hypothetical protein